MTNADGIEYAAVAAGIPGRGIEAWQSLSRALGVPLDVAVAALANGSAAGMIEARGIPCPGCGGTLLHRGEQCYCAREKQARARLGPTEARTLSGTRARALLMDRRADVPL